MIPYIVNTSEIAFAENRLFKFFLLYLESKHEKSERRRHTRYFSEENGEKGTKTQENVNITLILTIKNGVM